MDPLSSILKFFNAVIHISPKCLLRFLTIEPFSAAAEHVFFFHSLNILGDVQGFY